ncbi:MAG: NAD(P)(+) transhydrogenase (Re/Si-specific) subunit alpha, partial [Promicromonosporaceae bacterium]|nr:NAD(P)(+) transhydrogenase (Re/Si-specific) subunit alpha [Promicromonosporaceae bacterium]
MQIGVPKEARPGQRLVAATPATVTKLIKLGYDVAVEPGAGAAANFADDAYAAAGATIEAADRVWAADVVIAVEAPPAAQVAWMRPGAILIAQLFPAAHPTLADTYAAKGITALALDAVPRISRAQALDTLSTMSNVSGYRAVIEAANEYQGMFAGQVTAAGKTPPATVFVIGGGGAGPAALGTAAPPGAPRRALHGRPPGGG